MDTFKLRVYAVDRAFYEGECQSLSLPILDGQYGILPHHSNMIAAITPGMLTIRLPGREPETAAISTGLVKVENNEVLILADTIERPEEIDVNRARRAADAAREALLKKRSWREYRTAQANLAREVNRLRTRRELDSSML